MSDQQKVDALVRVRDGLRMAADAIDDYLQTFGPKEKQPGQKTAVNEETFTSLKFEPQQGQKIGAYDVAYKANNVQENWVQAFNILKEVNATIKARYRGSEYQFSYWLYGEGKIYRQKKKPT